MRIFVVALAMLAVSAAAVHAADDSPVVGKFPDTLNDCHVILFTLKKNGISLKDSPQDFCKKMDYGAAVYWHQPNEVGPDDKSVVRGNLDWVICRFGKAAVCDDLRK